MLPGAERSFRTKTGTCTVHDDRIVLERSGARGALANAVVGSEVNRVLVLYAVAALMLLGSGGRLALDGQWLLAALLAGAGLLLLRGVARSRGLSAAPVIARAAVTRIEARPPRPPALRGHFFIHFTEEGRALRRIVILPGALQGGSQTFTFAVELFRREGFQVEAR